MLVFHEWGPLSFCVFVEKCIPVDFIHSENSPSNFFIHWEKWPISSKLLCHNFRNSFIYSIIFYFIINNILGLFVWYCYGICIWSRSVQTFPYELQFFKKFSFCVSRKKKSYSSETTCGWVNYCFKVTNHKPTEHFLGIPHFYNL